MVTATVDVLAIGAHPDDIELFVGGTLALLVTRGWKVGALDLTRGEAGTRGTPESRAKERDEASRILHLSVRQTLDLGDSTLDNGTENRRVVARVIRELKPRVVITHDRESRHPDHNAAHELVRDACFLANVGGYDARGERHKIDSLIYFVGHETRDTEPPDWIVDITPHYETKLAALRAYGTQFFNPNSPPTGPQTYLSSPVFWDVQENFSRRWGLSIGSGHGEPFRFRETAHAGHAFVKMLSTANR